MNGEPVRLSKKNEFSHPRPSHPPALRAGAPRIFETPMEMISHGQNYR
jgi:hypothetical protein